MPNLASVTKYFPTPFENTVAMTLSGTIAPGATTVGITGLTNYSDGQTVVFTVDSNTPTLKQVFTGQKSGGNIVNVIWTYGTNQSHATGATVVDDVSATAVGMISKGMQVQHAATGAHVGITNTSGMTTDTLAVSSTSAFTGVATFTAIPVLPAGTITLGYADTGASTNFSTASGSPVQVTGLTVTVTIPAGGRKIKISAYAEMFVSATNAAVYMSIWDGAVGSGTQIQQAYINTTNAGAQQCVSPFVVLTPAAGSKTYNVGLGASGGTGSLAQAAGAPSCLLVEAL